MPSRLSRRAVLGAGVALGATIRAYPARAAYTARITVDLSAGGRPMNRAILGSNVQWVDRGDELIAGGTREPNPAMDRPVHQIAPTVLRYPGGSLSDLYPWRNGVSTPRGDGTHFFSGARQTVEFGTDEYLDLCARIGAKPLITVNVATGTPQDAADWVRYVDRGLRRRNMPPADWWEIGNEPYLREEGQRAIALGPDAYVKRARPIIAAMRDAAPNLVLGVPLRADQIGGRPATPFPGFNLKVLQGLRGTFDFVATHEAYAPYAVDRSYPDADLYRALMAAPEQIAESLAETRRQVTSVLGLPLPIGVTEWSALFSITGGSAGYGATAASALFAADVLRVFAQDPGVMVANYWSLSGNWYFGAMTQDGRLRPVGTLMAAFGAMLHGDIVPAAVDAPSSATPQVGFVAARGAVQQLTALAVRDGSRLTLSIVNRSLDTAAQARISVAAGKLTAASAQVMAAAEPFATEVSWRRQEVATGGTGIDIEVPPHAVAILRAEIA